MLSTGTVPTGRPYSLGEEIANSITHGAGLVGAIAGSAIMLFVVAQQHDRLWFFADAVYAMSLIIMYAASTFYHAIPNRRAKPIFRVMDHAAIYLLIAGTYTPFALLNLRGVWGWWLCAAVWVLAIIGVIFTALIRHRLSRATTVIYVVMGWMGLLAAKPALRPPERVGHHLAPGRWAALHRGHAVLRLGTPPLRTRHLARVRPRRQHLPLHRGLPLRGAESVGAMAGHSPSIGDAPWRSKPARRPSLPRGVGRA